jgi:hypothetical protein
MPGRGFLEYHHVVPFADGGETTVANLELRCRAHNAYETQRWAGDGGGEIARERGALYHARRSRGTGTRFSKRHADAE